MWKTGTASLLTNLGVKKSFKKVTKNGVFNLIVVNEHTFLFNFKRNLKEIASSSNIFKNQQELLHWANSKIKEYLSSLNA